MGTYSTTDRSRWKTCRGEWDVTSLSRQGLEYPLPNHKLLLGSLVHYTLADWIKDFSLDPTVRFKEHFTRAGLEVRTRYRNKFGCDMDEQEFERGYGEPCRDLGLAMITQYADYWKSPIPQGYGVVGVEQTVTIDVPGTEHYECSAPGDCGCFECPGHTWSMNTPCFCGPVCHKMEATFDALLADPKGKVWVIDHKTYEKKESHVSLEQNDQFLAYTWMANQLGVGKVEGVIYNGLWKRTWDLLLDKKGQPRKNSSGEPYTKDDLFFRTFVTHDRREVQDFGQRLAVELNEMGRPDVAIYLNRAWYSCPNCAIRDMCTSKTRGEDWTYMLDEMVPRVRTPAWRSDL